MKLKLYDTISLVSQSNQFKPYKVEQYQIDNFNLYDKTSISSSDILENDLVIDTTVDYDKDAIIPVKRFMNNQLIVDENIVGFLNKSNAKFVAKEMNNKTFIMLSDLNLIFYKNLNTNKISLVEFFEDDVKEIELSQSQLIALQNLLKGSI